MNWKDRNIEELFRTLFQQFTVNPSPGLWRKVQAKIFWKQFLSFGMNSFNVYYLALIMAVAGAGTYFMLSRPAPNRISENSDILPSSQALQPEPTQDQVISQKTQVAETLATNESKPSKKESIEPATPPARRQKETDDNTIPDKITADKVNVSGNSEPSPAQTTSSRNASLTEPDIKKVRIDFKAYPPSGCSPLAVNFQNSSENARIISWNFGDGGNSDELNPSYVFDEPGEFLVTLKVRGDDGQEYSRQQTIQVYETPKALFEFDEDLKPAKNQPINFYNYSRGGDYYEWDFGDSKRSDLQEPIHFYQDAGNYHVKLKVWTDHQCYDSMVV